MTSVIIILLCYIDGTRGEVTEIQPCFKFFTLTYFFGLSASLKKLFTVKSMPCQSTSTCFKNNQISCTCV